MGTVTAPADSGEFHVYDGSGNRIMDTRGGTVYIWGSVQILESVSIGGTVNISGTLHLHGDPSLLIDGNVSIGGTVSVEGTVHLHGDPSLLIDGDVTIGGTVAVTGDMTISGSLTVEVDIDMGGSQFEWTSTSAILYSAVGPTLATNAIFFAQGGLSSSEDITTAKGIATGTDAAIGGKFGCNGATPQDPYTLGSGATDLPTVLVLANRLRLMSIANGTGQV